MKIPSCPASDDALRRAQAMAARAIRGWHLLGGADMTLFEGVSLGRLERCNLAMPLAYLFHQAAEGRPPEAPDFWEDADWDARYEKLPDFSMTPQRTDARAQAFRALHLVFRSLFPARMRSALILAAPSNKPLWAYWLAQADRDIAFDFTLNNPPGPANALRSLFHGSRLFDPRPAVLSEEQRIALTRIQKTISAATGDGRWREQFLWERRDYSTAFAEQFLRPFIAKLESLAEKSLSFAAELERLRPSLILLPQDQTAEAVLLSFHGRRLGIPVWFLAHGFYGYGHSPDTNLPCGDLDADRILAWSGQEAGYYLSYGVPAERIVPAGFPAFDAFLPLTPPSPCAEVRGAAVMVVAHERPFSADYREGTTEKHFLAVARLLDDLGARRILFKLHPGLLRLDYYRRLAASLKLRCPLELFFEEPFVDVLAQADLVVGTMSTALFEVLLSGKDYYLIHHDLAPLAAPFSLSQPFVARDIEQLRDNLLSHNPIPRRMIIDEFLGLKGDETPPRFSRIVYDLIRDRLRSPAATG